MNHPRHYMAANGLEAIDCIEAQFGSTGHMPNAMKYLLRHQAKGAPVTDLGKARWYVDRLLTQPQLPAVMPRMTVEHQQHIADSFGLKGRARDALFSLIDAATFSRSEDRRMFLRQCSSALEDAIKALG